MKYITELAKSVLRSRKTNHSIYAGLDAHIKGYEQASKFSESLTPKTNVEPASGSDSELFSFFQSNHEGPGIWKWEHYFPFYERFLAPFKGEEVTLAEIGIYSGGSLSMWKQYLGDASTIIGIDIQPECKAYESDNIVIEIGDQFDKDFWNGFCGRHPKVDIILDDGSHVPEHQIVTFEALFNHLSPGGIYICEDIHGENSLFHGYLNGLSNLYHSFSPKDPNPIQREISSISMTPYMVVVEKHRYPIASLYSEKRGTEWQPFFEE